MSSYSLVFIWIEKHIPKIGFHLKCSNTDCCAHILVDIATRGPFAGCDCNVEASILKHSCNVTMVYYDNKM